LNAVRRTRRRTHIWFAVYTAALLAIGAASVAFHQWSVAATTLAIAVVFAWLTRWLWRRR
jgi:hypothetical protein